MDDRGRDPGPEATHTGDVLDRTLREVRALIESTVVEHRARRSRHAQFTEVGIEDSAFLAAAEQVITQARRGVDAVFPDASARMAPVHGALGALLTDLDGGVRVRVLRGRSGPGGGPPPGPAPVSVPLPGAERTADGAAGASGASGAAGSGAARTGTSGAGGSGNPGGGAGGSGGVGGRSPHPCPPQVRTAAVALPTAVIADGRTALVCTETEEGRRTSVVQDPLVVGSLYGMFGTIWAGAVPAARPLDFGNRARTEMVRRVLARLRDGVTDEAAARDLAISVRTYRRYVTGILELLEASSRFQAGVRAGELGILGEPPKPPPSPPDSAAR
ncbi:DNA-binding response regulator [Streptomyces cucumeris]|uniref:DNA-binding response regulator n=1 Tax=Streptomyces cucumeris TaxID=2962890 RepID=UPI0020C836A2|nr:DNA-binding response regulator [Streptomyces sp. NEAU-Y11]MCP9212440.1 DNA-binding response regulator [Streptomyces sp. NEAU-Y11]